MSKFSRENIRREMMDVLEHYKWTPTENGIEAIENAWFEAKSKKVIPTLSKMPNWNEEKMMVIFSNDYTRPLDPTGIKSFANWVQGKSHLFYPQKFRLFDDEYYMLRDVLTYMKANANHKFIFKGYTHNDRDKIEERLKYVAVEREKLREPVQAISTDLYDFLFRFCEKTEDNSNIITEEEAKELTEIMHKVGMPEKAKAVAGQRVAKVIFKILTYVGYDKFDEWNSFKAKFGDAVNPLHYKRHTIFSCNPIDYLRGSMGTRWSSCMTIDRAYVDNRGGESYHGMHAKGVLSYLLDDCTFVMYTVDSRYEGTYFELQDKVTRQLYHIGDAENPFFVQGRLYPQSNDSAEGVALYKQYREIVQENLAKAWDLPNIWKAPKDSRNYDGDLYTSKGSHYQDYTYFGTCKLSRHKETDNDNFKMITIGAQELCIECGRPHYGNDDELSCCSYFDEYTECACCGNPIEIDGEGVYEIDGLWYCDECTFYCEEHGEYELRGSYDSNMYYVEDHYGYYICEDAYLNGDYYTCANCGEIHESGGDEIYIEGSGSYCCTDCALDAGYEYDEIDNQWKPESEFVMCEECGILVHESHVTTVDGNDYCPDCVPDNSESVA